VKVWQRLVGRRPIVTRLVVAVAAAMTVVLVLATAFVYWRVSFALDRQLDQDLDAYQQVVEHAVRTGQPPPDDTPGEAFQVYDERGRQVAGDDRIPPLLDAQRLAAVRGGQEVRFDVGSFLPPPDLAYRVDAFRVTSSSGTRYVASAISRRKHDEALRELLLQLAIADLATLAAASFVGYRTARAALDPVERYRRTVERLERGSDVPHDRLPVAVDRDDELTRLGHTFNDLLDRIEESGRRERQFLADASHELRSPLSLLRTELEWHRHRPRSGAETATVLASMQGQVDRLVDLANALLEIEELRGAGPLPREAVAVDELVGAAVRGVPGASYPRVEVEAPATVVEVNRRWTELAVANLVRNGLRHGEGQVRVVADVLGDALVVTVSDEGQGFPDAFVAQAFDRFSRAEESRSTPGSGLGLSLVQAVARAHGGEASIERSAAGGRVRLELPS
jgi:signal transduction histidine kinase